MTKSKLGLGMAMMMVATSFTYADIQPIVVNAVVDVAKEAIDKGAEVAIKNNTKTTINHSDLIAKIDTQDTALLADGGVTVRGDTVNISDSTLKASIKTKRTIVAGNIGVNVGN